MEVMTTRLVYYDEEAQHWIDNAKKRKTHQKRSVTGGLAVERNL
jgi:hypothetical protein